MGRGRGASWTSPSLSRRAAAAQRPQLRSHAATPQPTRCLLTAAVLPSPGAALHRAASLGLDLRRLRDDLRLDLYGCVRLVNLVRREARE